MALPASGTATWAGQSSSVFKTEITDHALKRFYQELFLLILQCPPDMGKVFKHLLFFNFQTFGQFSGRHFIFFKSSYQLLSDSLHSRHFDTEVI